MKLTDKQRLFVDEYLIDFNATQAAIRAKYSKKTAYSQGQRLLKNVEVSKAIEARKAEKEAELVAGQNELLKLVTSVLRGEERGTALVGSGRGYQDVEDVPPTIAEKLKAAELLGKFHRTWADKVEIEGAMNVTFVDDIGDADE